MTLTVISDTHGLHKSLSPIKETDILIHCGDFTNIGEKWQIIDFIEWLNSHPHKHKIFIAGNHDRSFDPKFHKSPADTLWCNDTIKYAKELGLHYLENNSVIIDGVKFWGSPITPDFYPERWAFNRSRGEKINMYWETIPEYTDVVITHGPPANILDWCLNGNLVGCSDLTKHIQRIKPKFHFFGHIHESYGVLETPDITFVNASLLNHRYHLVNKPLEFNI
jgi:hypothetical protein